MIALAAAAFAIWLWLLLGHGGFWRAAERDDAMRPPPARWPDVVAVVPARDEADVIARSIGSLLAQDYPGRFRVVLVDDDSSDATADVAREAASLRQADGRTSGALELPTIRHSREGGGPRRLLPNDVSEGPTMDPGLRRDDGEGPDLAILPGAPLAPGWTGKLWALHQGIAAAGAPEWLWLTDADIEHAPDTLRSLVARGERDGRVLVSLMARLRCATLAERSLIPAFVFFFQMLYPFARVNSPGARTAGAAGGCMLVRRAALARGGGIGAVRGALIDDCAVGALLKAQGPVWLGLTDRSVSIRPYGAVEDVAAMIARSAYAQLGYSPVRLAGTIAGLALVYIAPPLLAVLGTGGARWLGLAGWAAMALAFQPTLAFYRRSPLWGLALPAIAAFYAGCTIRSAAAHARGRGGMWKGRAQAATEGR